MYIIKLTNIYFTLKFRRQNAVERYDIAAEAGHPGGRHGWLGGQPGVQHGWQLTHDGDDGRLTAQGEEAGGGSVGNI